MNDSIQVLKLFGFFKTNLRHKPVPHGVYFIEQILAFIVALEHDAGVSSGLPLALGLIRRLLDVSALTRRTERVAGKGDVGSKTT